MRTSKPISTISYNSTDYLKYRLNDLLQRHIIEFWCFIEHSPEEDEKKSHKHLFVVPNCLIDTMEFGTYFIEQDSNSDKALKTIIWRQSKIDDWILYNQHFEPYLLSKGETRKFHYSKEDFIYSDLDNFEIFYEHAFKGSDWAKNNQILEKLRDNTFSPADLVLTGMVSWTQSSQINALAHMREKYGSTKCINKTYRNGRSGHQ